MGLSYRDRRTLGPDHPALVALGYRLAAGGLGKRCAVDACDFDEAVSRIEWECLAIGMRFDAPVVRRVIAAVRALTDVTNTAGPDADAFEDTADPVGTADGPWRAPPDLALGPRLLAVLLTVAPAAPPAFAAG